MKSILYVGATLMIGASIYGFVDYKKSQHKQAFKNMYTVTDEPVDNPGPVTDNPVAEPKEPMNNTVVDKNVTAANNTVAKKETAKKNKKAVKKTKKKRKINVRLFSRGGLDDEYIEPPVKEIKPAPEVKNQ